ncbi:neuronal acetylcholine receptor subunit alpha-4-like [Culex pipiens pallens]|uniref:neuronal acetylcholine receptor subunit alpha-4-like n=1 Tax=Culex pipiens pallens TaxID=42434 RepID=UPI0019538759|nr:neuronal acetylcholine receptor subunit alpha-4-like [Culex pipiens pallens]
MTMFQRHRQSSNWIPLTSLAAVVVLLLASCPEAVSGVTSRFDCDNGNKGNATEIALKSALLCGTGYSPRQRPVKNVQDRVAMYIGADVMNVELIKNSNVKLEVTVELSMQWYDAYLHWNKKEHDKIHTLTVSDEDIWTPKLSAKSLFKSRVQGLGSCYQTKCHLSSDGEVIYSMVCTFEIDCLDDSGHWAFETKGCPLRIFTPEYDINQLSLFHFQRRLSYSVAGVMPYKIISFQMAIVNNTVNPEFRMDIVVERMIGPHLVVFLVFIIVLIALNLLITWFRVDTSVRGVMTVTSLALHVVYTAILFWYTNTKMEPALGMANLMLGSLLITAGLAGQLAYSSKMAKKESISAPRILQLIHRTITKNAAVKPFVKLSYISWDNPLVKPTTEPVETGMTNHVAASVTQSDPQDTIENNEISDDDEEDDVGEETDPAKLQWAVFMQPFDRIAFCGIAIVYVVMLLVLFLA